MNTWTARQWITALVSSCLLWGAIALLAILVMAAAPPENHPYPLCEAGKTPRVQPQRADVSTQGRA